MATFHGLGFHGAGFDQSTSVLYFSLSCPQRIDLRHSDNKASLLGLLKQELEARLHLTYDLDAATTDVCSHESGDPVVVIFDHVRYDLKLNGKGP